MHVHITNNCHWWSLVGVFRNLTCAAARERQGPLRGTDRHTDRQTNKQTHRHWIVQI